MKQVLVTEPGKIDFVDAPEPALGPRDVRLVITHSGLSSRSEIERFQRNYAGKPEPIGYNMVGRVDRVGALGPHGTRGDGEWRGHRRHPTRGRAAKAVWRSKPGAGITSPRRPPCP